VWKASELRCALADAGLELSAGKMSYLWSVTPISVRLDDLDVICSVLDCTPAELLIPDPPAVEPAAPAAEATQQTAPVAAIRPARRGNRRAAPPV
jgi:DNA-binding Xre family transcriptional regulator